MLNKTIAMLDAQLAKLKAEGFAARKPRKKKSAKKTAAKKKVTSKKAKTKIAKKAKAKRSTARSGGRYDRDRPHAAAATYKRLAKAAKKKTAKKAAKKKAPRKKAPKKKAHGSTYDGRLRAVRDAEEALLSARDTRSRRREDDAIDELRWARGRVPRW